MTAETDLLPLPGPDYLMPQGQGWPDIPAWSENTVRQIVAHATAPLQAEIEALRAEVERLNRILERIVEGDGGLTVGIRWGTDAFAAAREYLLREQEEGK